MSAHADTDRPNFVIMLTDDQGYHDMGCYGAQGFSTPNFDRMALEGIRFTNFHVAAPTCTASRAALLTGCYPQRIGLPEILRPWSTHGLSNAEQTVADLLHEAGYATACFGKWHLGHHREFLPTSHGFDEFFGLPYSNDMWPNHPVPATAAKMPLLPLMEGDRILEFNPDQTQLTTWYTERAVSFIERNAGRPFLLYMPQSMPHVPLHVSSKFKGRSELGLYGDVMMEIDWSMGQVIATLKRLGLDERTMIFFASDNGPWLEYGDHAGSAGALREGKWTTFEGGQRVLCLMRWPGMIPPGQVLNTMVTTLDMLPTIVRLSGAAMPRHEIDGHDIWPILAGETTTSPHEAFYFYREEELEAIQSGSWKLHLPHSYKRLAIPGTGGKPGRYDEARIELSLFDIERDEGERYDVAAGHPEIARELAGRARAFDRELRSRARKPGRVLEDGVLDARRMIVYEPEIASGFCATEVSAGARTGVELRFRPEGSSRRLTIGLPIVQKDHYEISAKLFCEGGSCALKLTIDGTPLGGTIEVPDRAGRGGEIVVGSRELDEGVHSLSFDLEDSPLAAAPALVVMIDYLRFRTV